MIDCLLLLPLFVYVGGCVWSFSARSSFAIILLEKREPVDLLWLYLWCHVTVSVLCLVCIFVMVASG